METLTNITPAFTRLPAELLISILEQQHADNKENWGDMYVTLP